MNDLLDFHIQVEQITAEYKALALQYHPDKNEGNKEAEAKFQQLKVTFTLPKKGHFVQKKQS